ncbi:MAG: DUF2911 domain-containing protein, partial [Longimicrobiales bacterium]|nr:DUF2911 domain-containing protein [Longimicrobiales bacterium]
LDGCWLREGSTAEDAANRASPMAAVDIPLGDETARLCYSRPSARGRTIMGELVPFGQIWRTGANEATELHLPVAVTVGGAALEPGRYALYSVPGESEWEFVLSSNTGYWGNRVDASVRDAEVASFTRPARAIEEMVETFTIRWDAHGPEMGHLVLEWEHTRVEIPIHRGGGHH